VVNGWMHANLGSLSRVLMCSTTPPVTPCRPPSSLDVDRVMSRAHQNSYCFGLEIFTSMDRRTPVGARWRLADPGSVAPLTRLLHLRGRSQLLPEERQSVATY
jgi:hypothetical protein